MPRVPIFDGVPTANLAPASGPQLQAPRTVPVPGDPGEGLQQAGQAMMGLGQQVARRQEEERQKLASAMAKSGYNQFRGAVDSEFNALKGLKLDAALQGKQKTTENIRKHYEKILGSMTDEDAKDAFSQAAEGLMVSAQSDIDNYARVQNEEFQSITARENQQWMERDAVDAWVKEYEARSYDSQRIGPPSDGVASDQEPSVPSRIGPPVPPVSGEQFESAAIGNINDEADRMGLPKDSPVREAMIRESRARVNERVVESLTAMGRFDDAEKHLSESMRRGEFDPDRSAKLTSSIRERRVSDAALRQVVEWNRAGVPLPARVEAAETALAEGRIAPDAYRAIMDEAGKAERQRKDVEDAAKSEALDAAKSFFSRNRLATADDFKAAAPQQYEVLEQTGGLTDLFALQGKFIVTNRAAYLEAMHVMTDREVRSYSRQSWALRYATLLDQGDHDKVMARHDQVTGEKDGLDVIGRERRILKGFSEVYKDRFPGLNIYNPESLKDEKIAEQYDRFLEQLQSRIDSFEADGDGKKATTDDVQKIIDGMKQERAAIKSSTLGVDWASGDLNINVNSLLPEDRENIYVPTPRGDVFLKDVPMEEEKQITAALSESADEWLEMQRAKGYDVTSLDIPPQYRATPANVVRLWVGAGAVGAAPGSSGDLAAPEKLGPPLPPSASDASGSNVLVPAGSAPNMAEALANVRAGGAERRAKTEAYAKMKKEVYEKFNVPPFRVWHMWAPDPAQVKADAEIERRLKAEQAVAADRIVYERLFADRDNRRAAMDSLREKIDSLTQTLGKNHPMVQSYERNYQDLGLIELKMQTMRAYFEENGK